jgi:hypothetical protein
LGQYGAKIKEGRQELIGGTPCHIWEKLYSSIFSLRPTANQLVMARGIKVHAQVLWAAARMLALGYKDKDIRLISGLSQRKFQEVKNRFLNMADPSIPAKDPLLRKQTSRRALSDEQINVRHI